MNHSNWTVLALVFCLGACQGPGSEGPGALTYGQRCDVEVRNDFALLSVATGWSDVADYFYVRPNCNSYWVVGGRSSRIIKELCGGTRYRVRIDEAEMRVWIGCTDYAVVRRSTNGHRGSHVNPNGGGTTEVVFWLMVGNYAYEIVVLKRVAP